MSVETRFTVLLSIRTTLQTQNMLLLSILFYAIAACCFQEALLEEDGMEKLQEKVNKDTLKWGPYRSNVYLGVRPRIPESIITGLMWFPAKSFDGMQKAKHACDQAHNIEKFGWVKYDPRYGGREEIIDRDSELKLSVEFVKSASGQNWALRVVGKALSDNAVNSVVFYTGLEGGEDDVLNLDADYVDGSDNLVDGDVKLKGDVKKLGKFSIDVVDGADNEYVGVHSESLSFDGAFDPSYTHHVSLKVPGEKVWQANEVFWTLVQMNVEEVETREVPPSSFTAAELFQVRNPGGFSGNLHFIQKTFVGDFQFDIVLNEEGTSESEKITAGEDVTKRLGRAYKAIDAKFARSFQLSAPFNKEEHVKFAKEVVSQLLGGLLYQYGDQLVDREARVDDVKFTHAKLNGKSEGPHELFSFVPSRPFFPRGFYWDEGFHLMPVLAYDTDLAMDVLEGWFALMDDDGWIAREQILGNEARSKVPAEFTVQNPRIANPPTLLMVLGEVVESMKSGCADDEGDSIVGGVQSTCKARMKQLRRLYPYLQRHYEWFRRTQRGEAANIDHRAERYPSTEEVYRWKGRTKDHSLPSGLDDYPRCDADASELDVDLLSWMGLMTRAMKDVATVLGENSDANIYGERYKDIVRNLEEVHWSNKDKMFCDLSEDEDGEGDEFACHEGYVSLMPFMHGHIRDEDSERLSSVVASVVHVDRLWSRAGVRSLSRADPLYHVGEDYWRGHVWVNANWLLLKGLSRCAERDAVADAVRAQCADAYAQLRATLVETVVGEYARTGYAWEQYNDETGRGQRTRHFLGWTSLVVLIMQMPEKV